MYVLSSNCLLLNIFDCNCFTILISRQEFKHDVKQPGGESIILENDNLKVEFESFRGLLKVILTPPLVIFTKIKIVTLVLILCHAIVFQSITHKEDGAVTQVAIDFVSYGTKSSGDRSGAYLFLPNGPAEVCLFDDRSIRNPLLVFLKMQGFFSFNEPQHRAVGKLFPCCNVLSGISKFLKNLKIFVRHLISF